MSSDMCRILHVYLNLKPQDLSQTDKFMCNILTNDPYKLLYYSQVSCGKTCLESDSPQMESLSYKK